MCVVFMVHRLCSVRDERHRQGAREAGGSMGKERHVVFGCNGPVGQTLCDALYEAGHAVVGVCRSGRASVPEAVRVVAADAADAARAAEVSTGADVIHVAVGLPYVQWTARFPGIVEGVLHAASATGARLVWTDNLYAYGPRDTPLREDMALSHYGKKPALRARLVERMMEAHATGRVQVAIVRASDFIGPRVRNAMLGTFLFERALAGKSAQFVGNPDLEHDYTYVPDLVRTQVAVAGDASAFGEAWHVPNPPTRTSAAIIEDVFARLERPARITTLPAFMVRILGLFDANLRELCELQYQWRRPFRVDSTRARQRFGIEATDWDTILDRTLAWYREAT